MPSACAPTYTDISAATQMEAMEGNAYTYQPMDGIPRFYRVVWHSEDPMNANRVIGPGTVDDYIKIRDWPEPSNANPTPHVIYLQYNGWKAEFNCRYEDDYMYDRTRDYIKDLSINYLNPELRRSLASPRQIQRVLREVLLRERGHDTRALRDFRQLSPIDVCVTLVPDEVQLWFLQVSVLCAGLDGVPYFVILIAKWDEDVTTALTNEEREELGISDHDWFTYGQSRVPMDTD